MRRSQSNTGLGMMSQNSEKWRSPEYTTSPTKSFRAAISATIASVCVEFSVLWAAPSGPLNEGPFGGETDKISQRSRRNPMRSLCSTSSERRRSERFRSMIRRVRSFGQGRMVEMSPFDRVRADKMGCERRSTTTNVCRPGRELKKKRHSSRLGSSWYLCPSHNSLT